jgi:hypothetical protein
MPTVLRHPKGWRVVVYPNDHRPPHVHVLSFQEHARFELLCDLQRVALISNLGFTYAQINSIALLLSQNIAKLCNEWGKIHGH